jgi:hypothetical protein
LNPRFGQFHECFAQRGHRYLIFIDKLNVSGIEMRILDSPMQKIASLPGNQLARLRQPRTILTFMGESGTRLESLRRRVDPFERS